MNCPKCNSVNEPSARFCKNCGWDLTATALPVKNENYLYFGIIALMFPILLLLFRIHHKIYLLLYNQDDYYKMYDTISYKVTSSFLSLIWFSLPILIVVKIKNMGIKIVVIVLCAAFFVMELLAQLNIYNWNDFWYHH